LIGPVQEAALAAQEAAQPDATLALHCQHWFAQTGQRLSTAAMCRSLQRLQLTRKKSTSWPASKTLTNGPPGGP
jgi:hypothetical protein